jgi:hypothetical protein
LKAFLTDTVNVYRETDVLDLTGEPQVVWTFLGQLKGRLYLKRVLTGFGITGARTEPTLRCLLSIPDFEIQVRDIIEYGAQRYRIIAINYPRNWAKADHLELILEEQRA